MTFDDATRIIQRHSGSSDARSFIDMLLMCELSGEINNSDLENSYTEMVEASEIVNKTMNFSSQKDKFVDRDLSLDVCSTIAEGWEQYADWSSSSRLPADSLNRLSSILSNLQFAWCRILDGSTENISQAIEDRQQ